MRFDRPIWLVPLVVVITVLGFVEFGILGQNGVAHAQSGPPMVTNLVADCNSSGGVSGMIDVPADARHFPWTVFAEYKDGENWRWAEPSGSKIDNRYGSVNFELDVGKLSDEDVTFRVRFKDADWVYGELISPEFSGPCEDTDDDSFLGLDWWQWLLLALLVLVIGGVFGFIFLGPLVDSRRHRETVRTERTETTTDFDANGEETTRTERVEETETQRSDAQ